MKKRFIIGSLICAGIVFWGNAPQKSFNVDAEIISEYTQCTYSAALVEEVSKYGADSVTELSNQEAIAQNIPVGYTGNVLVVDGSNNRGIVFDYSASNILAQNIKSMTFRVYVGDDGNSTDSYPQLRIAKPGFVYNSEFVMMYQIGNDTNKWIDVTLYKSGNNFYNGATFDDLAKGGILNCFELSVRNNANAVFYIDGIWLEMETDEEAPVISYQGDSTVYISEGAKWDFGISAFDAFENQAIELEYVWSEDTQFFEDGTLKQGEYQLVVNATDGSDNSSSLSLKVIVTERDETPPIIHIATETVSLLAGTIPIIDVEVTDNRKVSKVSYVWSENALDGYGRLTSGTHTLTVTAADSSGNTAEKNVTFYVLADISESENIIDEEGLISKEENNDNVNSETIEGSSEESGTESREENGMAESVPDSVGNESGKQASGCGNVISAVGALSSIFLGGIALFYKKRNGCDRSKNEKK